jgi:hypothetical protein
MTVEDPDRAGPRSSKAERASHEAKSTKTDRDLEAKAVLDNMAKLKALRLAREAATPKPAATVKKTRAAAGAKSKKSGEKGPALADWLAGQQSGGHRT